MKIFVITFFYVYLSCSKLLKFYHIIIIIIICVKSSYLNRFFISFFVVTCITIIISIIILSSSFFSTLTIVIFISELTSILSLLIPHFVIFYLFVRKQLKITTNLFVYLVLS